MSSNRDLELARLAPAGFAMFASNGDWQLARHLAYLNDAIMDLVSRKNRRLIVSMPPRHGKSEFISKYLPAWIIGALHEKVLLASYEADFAEQWGRKARDVFEEYAPRVFGAKLNPNIANAKHWESTEGGSMQTAGVGGPLTGKGGNWLIIDDPVKNAEEAESDTIRNKADDWFRSTAYTRLEPNGVIIIVMTRWHEDDIVGRLLSGPTAHHWREINFPALAEESDELGRTPGEALWPARYDVQALEEIKMLEGPYFWSSLYQQSPTVRGGTKIQYDWWNLYDELPHQFRQIVICWDTAWGTKETSDYSVAAVWGVSQNGYYLIELKRDRVEFPTLLEWAHQLQDKYPRASHLIEDAASGIALRQMLKKETRYVVRTVKVQTDKVSRLNGVIHAIEAGRCYLPRKAKWLHDFMEEHRRFPNSAYKDQVDSTTLMLGYFLKHGSLVEGSNPQRFGLATKASIWDFVKGGLGEYGYNPPQPTRQH